MKRKKSNDNFSAILDKDGIPKVVSTKEYLGDASGMAAINCISQMCSNISYFYTDKVGISVASVSLIMLISTLSDGISDLIMGRLFDKVHFKEGKSRPWLKLMIVPVFLSIILLTLVPDISPFFKNLYAIITMFFARAVVFTGITIPYFALINYTTKSLEERGKMGNMRTVFNNVVGILFGATVLPITNLLGGTQQSWIIFAAGLGLLGSLLLAICYKCTHERYVDNTESTKNSDDGLSLLTSLKFLLHNKYWVSTVVAQFFLFVIFVLQGATLPYYAKWILGNDNLVAAITLSTVPIIIISFLLMPYLIKKTSLKITGIIGVVVGIIGVLIRLIDPYNLYIFMIGNSGVTFATSALSTVLLPMIVNTSEWNEYKFGYKLIGMTNSAASFGSKVGAALGSAVMGMVLSIGGYNPNVIVQSQSSINSISFLNIHTLGICFVIILLCFLFYNLEKKYPTIVKENEKRRNRNG